MAAIKDALIKWFSETRRFLKKGVFDATRALAVALALLLLAPLCSAGAEGAADYALTLAHTNDQHSAYGGYDKHGRVCYAASCEGGRGGTLRLKRAVSAVKRDAPEALFLDAGDIFLGTLYWVSQKEAMPAAVMDKMGYDAIAVGNHEFDDGCANFLRMVKELKTPFVSANLSFSAPFAAASKIAPWVVVERSGRKIAIIGLTTTDTPRSSTPCSQARFADETEALRRAVGEVSALGANIVIALTHVGLDNDKRLARAVSGVDIIVGGHSHSLLGDGLPGAVGPYPVVEKSPEGKPVLIVTAACNLLYMGRLEAAFDAAGVLTRWSGGPLSLDDAALKELNAPPPDAELAGLIEKFSVPARELKGSAIGEISAGAGPALPPEEPGARVCRRLECRTADIVADAMLAGAGGGADVVLLNAGAVRNPLPVGKVTMGDVLDTLPYNDYSCLALIPGHMLLAALEHGVARYEKGGGAFLQVAGLRYAFDPRREPGARIVRAETRGADGQWRAVRADETYRALSTWFLASGGDGYDMFTSLAWEKTRILQNMQLADYLGRNSPLSTVTGDRIEIIR